MYLFNFPGMYIFGVKYIGSIMLEIVGGYVYGGVILAGDQRIVCVRPLLHDPNSNYKRNFST